MEGLEHCAHLLAVWHLSAEQGEQLEEGAQEERAAGRGAGHGRERLLDTPDGTEPQINFGALKVTVR